MSPEPESPSHESSETSPLLQSEGNGRGPKLSESLANGTIPEPPPEDGEDLERLDSVDSDRAKQFAGNPEVLKKLKFIVPAVGIGIYLSAADQTIIVASYGRIGSELNALNLTSWIATSYFLTLTAFQPLFGKLSDIFGRKPCLLCAYSIFAIGCLFCGLAQDINQLIAARVFQGIGGGGMTTVVSIIFSDIIPLKDRGIWQGIINIIYASGAGSGAPLGGLLADYVGWRWAFLCQFPLCLLAFTAVFFTLTLPAREQRDWKTNLGRIDFLGALVLLGAVFCLIFSLDRGSNVAWSIPITYGSLATSVVLFIVFILVETKVAAEPFAPGHIIFNRPLLAGYLCNFFSFGGWLAALYYLPLFFQAVDGTGATGAAVRLLAPIIAGVSGSLFGGFVMRQTGRYYWLTVIAYSLLTTGLIVIVLFSGLILNNLLIMSTGMMMCGFGNGIGVTTSLIALIANAAPADQAVTTACSYLFRSLGSVVGISLCSTVVNQSLRKTLADALRNGKDADQIEKGVRRSLDYIKTLDPATQVVVRQCYNTAMTYGFTLMAVIASGAAISSFFLLEKKLSK